MRYHEVHEDNEEKKLHALYVLHGKKKSLQVQNVITASFHLLYRE